MRGWTTGRVAGAAMAAALALAPAASAGPLPSVSSGARPGPDVLYAGPAAAPQLENASPWSAPPILVSGAAAYSRGEYLYQDYIYDDHNRGLIPDSVRARVEALRAEIIAGRIKVPSTR